MIRMLLRVALVLVVGLVASTALAENSGQIPTKFTIPFANGPATSPGSVYITNPIPTLSQIGILNCAASFTDGFPPLTFTPSAGGGCAPFGKDFNGTFYMISRWSRWQAMGGPVFYDSGFSSSISGYPKWTALANAGTPGCFWISQVDGNTSNPDTGGANWLSSCPTSGNTGTSTGSGNSQVVTSAPFAASSGSPIVGAQCTFVAGFSNTGGLKVNCNGTGLINVYRRSQLGVSLTVGGEVVANQLVTLVSDGTEWQCTSCTVAMVGEEKTFTGATVPSGWQIENGSCISQSTYADLYSYYGSADLWLTQTGGSACAGGSFHVPFANGRTAVAYDQQGGVTAGVLTSAGSGCAATAVAVGCGSQNRTVAQANLPNVNFTISGGIKFLAGDTTVAGASGAGVTGVNSGGALENSTTSLVVSSGGSGSALTTVQPTYTTIKAVKL